MLCIAREAWCWYAATPFPPKEPTKAMASEKRCSASRLPPSASPTILCRTKATPRNCVRGAQACYYHGAAQAGHQLAGHQLAPRHAQLTLGWTGVSCTAVRDVVMPSAPKLDAGWISMAALRK